MTVTTDITQPIGEFRTDFDLLRQCPRCQRQALPLGYPGALSRADNKTEVCSPCGQVEGLADAWLELGDWNQWNDRPQQALAAYGEVASLLQGAGLGDLLHEWLGQPVELPANGAFWQPRPGQGATEPVVVQASYDVSAAGRASNVDVKAVASEHAAKAGKVRRSLGQTRFRPSLVDGEPQASARLSRQYEVLD